MPTASQPPSDPGRAGEALAPITGELTRAGTFPIRDEETTGLLISLSVEALRAVPRLPLYRRVAVVDAAALAALQRENEHLRHLCADRDFHHAESLRQRAALTAIVRTWERESEACADNTNAGHAMATHARAALLPNLKDEPRGP